MVRVLCAVVICLSPLAGRHAWAKGGPSAKDARRLITRMAGASLPSGAVRIKTITAASDVEAVALAQIETAFRLESGEDERWRVAELRTGSDRWEDISLLAQAAQGETTASAADADAASVRSVTMQASRTRAAAALDARLAREVLAQFLAIELPSDDVRVKEVSTLYNSAIVVAQVAAEFRFQKGSDNKWHVSHVRTGGGEWKDVELIVSVVNREKARRARSELELMAAALDSFRRARGFYPVADTTGALVDQLNPGYLARVLRLDPWHQPYLYEGERDRYVLRSAGADAKPGTADDVELSGHAQALGNTGR